MEHVKQALERIKQHASKAKFFQSNREIFLQHFDNVNQYDALITSGNFDKMESIIKDNTNFKLSSFRELIK